MQWRRVRIRGGLFDNEEIWIRTTSGKDGVFESNCVYQDGSVVTIESMHFDWLDYHCEFVEDQFFDDWVRGTKSKLATHALKTTRLLH